MKQSLHGYCLFDSDLIAKRNDYNVLLPQIEYALKITEYCFLIFVPFELNKFLMQAFIQF
jgi:hypothetical protein